MISAAAFWLAFLAFFATVTLIAARRGVDEEEVELRAIPAYETIRGSTSVAAEEGLPIHLSLGTAGLADANAMETVAALSTLDFLSEQAALTANPPLVTTASPTTLVLAQEVLSRPFQERDQLAEFDPLSVRFIGGSGDAAGVAYAAGVIDLLDHRYVSANFMQGRFGDEYLLMGEVGARNDVPQVVGTANVEALPFMLATAGPVLIGEDVFAAGAYLLRSPWHIAGLRAQDVLRWLIAGAVLAVVGLRTLGMLS